jgi:hypothetical protein
VFAYNGTGNATFGAYAPPRGPSFTITPLAGRVVCPNWFPGEDVGAQVNNAYAALPLVTESSFPNGEQPSGVISLAGYAGEIYLSTTIALASRRVSLIGPGRNNLTLLCRVVGGDCVRIYDNAFGNLSDGMVLKGFQLAADPNTAGSNTSVGIHSGGMWQLRMSDLLVRDFNGVGGIGIWFDNGKFTRSAYAYTEEGEFEDITLIDNTTSWRFSQEGHSGDFSYGYNEWRRILILTDTGQTGVLVDGEPTGWMCSVIYHSTINWVFEPLNARTKTTTAIRLADYGLMQDNHYVIYQEPTYGSVVFQFILGNNATFTGEGQLQFFSSNNRKPLTFTTGANAIFNVAGSVVFNNTQWCAVGPAGQRVGTVTLSPGWGNAANVASCAGSWNGLWLRLFATGTMQAANPQITFNFGQTAHTANPQLTWGNPPVCSLEMVGASVLPAGSPLITQGDPPAISKTSAQFQVNFTPVANASYDFLMRCTAK